MKRLSVLVVDDVEAFGRLLADGLRESGHRVALAVNGAQAAAMLSKLRFDLVVTDIIMPVSDGFELIEAVRRAQPAAKVIAMSGGGKLYSADACLEAAREAAVDAVMEKPFGPQALKEAIERLFGSADA
jgi:CheY-like chemotaxis protein